MSEIPPNEWLSIERKTSVCLSDTNAHRYQRGDDAKSGSKSGSTTYRDVATKSAFWGEACRTARIKRASHAGARNAPIYFPRPFTIDPAPDVGVYRRWGGRQTLTDCSACCPDAKRLFRSLAPYVPTVAASVRPQLGVPRDPESLLSGQKAVLYAQ